MKTRSIVIIFLFVTAWVHADDRPTIDFLIGKQIYVEDAFAGQSFTLLKGLNGNKDYRVEWIRHGSAVPAIRSQTCKVRLDGKYQFRFSLDHPEEKTGNSWYPFPVKMKSRFTSMAFAFILTGHTVTT